MGTRHTIARVLFRCRFPFSGSFSGCDFRPHFDGHLFNACSTIRLQGTADEVRDLACRRFRQIGLWLRRIRWCCGPGDRIQLIVGWPLPPVPQDGDMTQIFKGWIPANRLRDIETDFGPGHCERLGGDCVERLGWQQAAAHYMGKTS